MAPPNDVRTEYEPDQTQQEKMPVAYVEAAPIVAAQERAQLDVQINTAKHYPRSISRAKAQVLTLATCDKETAETCFYALPREGKLIEGPSVRLAEIIAASYQNLRCAARVMSIDATHVTAQGVAHDLENNVAASTEVKRRITKSSGVRYSDDMIVVTSNAACSIALRNAIFKVVPSAIFREEFKTIRTVAEGDAKTLTETRKALLDYFRKTWKVSDERVLVVVERHGIEDITMEDVRILRGLATALKDNETTVDQAFPSEANSGALQAGTHEMKRKPGRPRKEHAAETPEPEGAVRHEPPTTPAPDPAPAFDREGICAEIQNLIEEWVEKDYKAKLAAFDKHLERVGHTKDDWPQSGEGILERLLSAARDIKVMEAK